MLLAAPLAVYAQVDTVWASTLPGPQLAEKAYNSGLASFSQQRYPAALASFDQAIAARPDFAAAYTNRAATHFELRNYPAALADYSQALKMEPGSYTGYFGRARAHEAQRELKAGDEEYLADPARYVQALPHYLTAQEFNPNNAALNVKIGDCHLHSATKTAALPYLQNAAKLDANADPRTHFLLGRALHLSAQWREAIAEYQRPRPCLPPTAAASRPIPSPRCSATCRSAAPASR